MSHPMGSTQPGLACRPVRSDTRMEAGPRRPGPGLRILVVDDEVGIRRALHRMLGRDHRVETARDGRDARERLASGEHFHVILCDLMMPRMSGVQLYVELAAEAPEDARRIVFMTGGALPEPARQLLEGCGNPVLHKPMTRDDLEAAFHSVLESVRDWGALGTGRGKAP